MTTNACANWKNLSVTDEYDQEASAKRKGRSRERPGGRLSPVRDAYRAASIVAMTAIVFSIVLMPFAISSLVAALRHPTGDRAYHLTTPTTLAGEWTKLNIAAVGINEATQTVTLRISGFHNCPARCVDVERIHLYSVHADPSGAFGSPPSVVVDLPLDSSEVEQQVMLPMSGDLIDYPFDHYRLLLGVAFAKVGANGKEIPFSPVAASNALAYSIDNLIPRVALDPPRFLKPSQYDVVGASYDSVSGIDFYRPAYLRILTVLLTLLIVLATAYGVFIRPFTQIIPTVGGLVLGVWGIRSLLVGGYPPDSTGVDLVLEASILLLLLTVTARAVYYMWPKSRANRIEEG